MKIIGFAHIESRTEMILSADSALLNGRKPFFLPEWSGDVRYTPCTIVRISRLGKNISTKFAGRYYDALAYGADFVAWDRLSEAIANGHSWAEATAFDYSLATGEWQSVENATDELTGNLIVSIDEAIHRASQCMTIRQGDLIYIHHAQAPHAVVREMTIEANGLYCKIK